MAERDEAVLITDREGRMQYVNAAACDLLRYSRDDLLALALSDTYPPEDVTLSAERIRRLGSGEELHFQRRVRRSDGTCFRADIRWKILDDGRFRAMIRPLDGDALVCED